MNQLKTSQIVESIKHERQDFEFYPTTDEIIKAIKVNLYGCSILDIGAGNGATLDKLVSSDKWKKYAIEKSSMLQSLINPKTIIIGTDFFENSLWDKKVDVIFCNPPYSDYINWMYKIISEAAAKQIYLVIPKRWSDNEMINDIIAKRGYKVESLGIFDFLDAERAARCNVDVIMLTPERYKATPDFFDVELAKYFDSATVHKYQSRDDARREEREQFDSSLEQKKLVLGDFVAAIVSLYHDEQTRIYATLKALSEIDASLYADLEINLSKIKGIIRDKLEQLSSKYWCEVIAKLHPITSRLTSNNSKKLLESISDSRMSFNAANIYGVVEFVIRSMSSKIEEQILEVYNELISDANCSNYKSNKTVFVGNNFQMKTASKLNYRIVISKWRAIETDYFRNSYNKNLSERCHSFLNDLSVIANNLGYEMQVNASYCRHWQSGKLEEFHAIFNNEQVLLFTVKAFKNGNLHMKFDTAFNHKLNVIKGKYEGWIHSVNDVMSEFDVTEDEAAKLFEEIPKLSVNVAGLLN